ncbi:hypothetical protein KR026_000884, partial [Drosophila bipectinata]
FDFDDLLPVIGEFGRFQFVLFLYMIPFGYIAAFVYLGQIFMTLKPHKYYCFVPQLTLVPGENLRKQLSIPRETDGSFSRCRMFDRNYTNMHATVANNTHYVDDLLPTIPCQYGYVFEEENLRFYSATMEFGWLCDNDMYATYSQFIFFVGSILGCVGYPYFADHVGRLGALVSSCSLAILGSLATAASSNFYAFSLARLLVGASYDTCFTMAYIVVHEYVGPNYRTVVAYLTLALFYCPFTMLMPWIALLVGNWRRFALMGCLPIIFGMVSYFLLPESARWLVSRGNFDKALKLLKLAARQNRKVVPADVLDNFKVSCAEFYQEETKGRKFTFLSIFRRRRMARFMILLIFLWMTISLVYDGQVRVASVLDTKNLFVYFTLSCATELPGYFLVFLTLDRFGRRWSSFAFTTLSGVFSLIGSGMKTLPLMKICALASRFFASMSFNIGLQWAAEILPTVVRGQGVSFIHTMGFVAMLGSPPIIYLSHFSVYPMLLVLGCIGLFGGLVSLLLPETLNHELPETISEGEDFAKDQRFWHSPCCGPGRRKSHPRHSRMGSTL